MHGYVATAHSVPSMPVPTPAVAAAATQAQQEPTATNSKKRKPAAAATNTGPRPPRILVAAHTNVAVDRVLLALKESGFTDMLRVGSLPRIAKKLLGYSLHAADDKRDALGQLQSMLQEAQGIEAEMIK